MCAVGGSWYPLPGVAARSAHGPDGMRPPFRCAMPDSPNLSLRRSKRAGLRICAAVLVLAALFGFGLWEASYWAVAVPVGVGVTAALALAFWIGWTIATIDAVPREAERYEGRGARFAAILLCLLTVALAALFGYGLWLRSYWALAIPVAVAVFGLLGMVFHIGWAILTQRTTHSRHRKSLRFAVQMSD